MAASHGLSHYNPPVSCKGRRRGYKSSIAAGLYVCEIIASDSRGGLWLASQRLLNEPNVSSAKSLQLQTPHCSYCTDMVHMDITRMCGHFTFTAVAHILVLMLAACNPVNVVSTEIHVLTLAG